MQVSLRDIKSQYFSTLISIFSDFEVERSAGVDGRQEYTGVDMGRQENTGQTEYTGVDRSIQE